MALTLAPKGRRVAVIGDMLELGESAGALHRDSGRALAGRVDAVVGVGPLASARTAAWIRDNVPGVHIPDAIINRLLGADSQKEEGVKICVEMIQRIREIDGVHGVHVMAYRQEERVPDIINASGVLDGRSPWFPPAGQ